MNLKVAQVIGLNTDQKAAQVSSTIRDADNAFFALIKLSSDDAFTKGRQILSELSDLYFDTEGSAAEKLKATLLETPKKIPPEADYELILAAISGKVLYLIGQGEVDVYLKRDDRLSQLLSLSTPSQLVSGFLQEGDRILITTKSLATLLGDDLNQSLALPTETFEEEISSKIGSAEVENGGLAALMLEIEQPPSAPEEPIPPATSDELPSSTQPEPVPNLLGKMIAMISDLISLSLRAFPKSGRGRLILAIIIILVIALGVGYQYKVSRDQQTQQQFNNLIQEAKDDFNGAKGLASLNPKEAKDRLESAKGKVNQALKLKPKDEEAINLKNQIEQESASILKQSTASEFPEFLDLDLIKKDFKADKMTLSSGKMLVLDPVTKTLVSIDVSKKSHQILAGSEQLGQAKASSINGSLAFVYSEDKGILRVDITNKKVSEAAKKDDQLQQIADIYGFAGNIYLLDSGGNQIWKYLPTPSGYSDKRAYLTAETKADFSGSVRMQIESSVYVLKSNGEMLRFTRGSQDSFAYSGLDQNVKDPKSFFVSSDTEDLYLLDSGNSRLVILTKAGEYKGQISGEKFGTATDLVVDEVGKKVYLLEGSKIYQVDLK
ncbi:hypothetical protein HYS94_04285 [Candidatus Daviesbacteria bacterium]|nr:hypothetical protein [Candidatus Daviesbacteria bacterium]